MTALVSVQQLVVDAVGVSGLPTRILHGIDLEIAPGEVVAAIGPSGSGKSTLGLSLAGYFRPGLRASAGRILFAGIDITTLAARDLRRLRRQEIAFVPQSAAAGFNPAMTVNAQVTERLRLDGLTTVQALHRARALFAELDLPVPAEIGSRYPHQLSGGQLQRVAVAMAFAGHPKLVIFDEPTTSLDVMTQVAVLGTFRRILRSQGVAALYVSHDVAVVAQLADRIIVLEQGRCVMRGPAPEVLAARAKIAPPLRRAGAPRPSRPPGTILLSVGRLTFSHARQSQPAVNDVSFDIRAGEIVGLIGESGSGKSTVARLLAGLLVPASGSIALAGERLAADTRRRPADVRRSIQIVFQSSDLALNPRHRVRETLGRPLALFRGLDGAARTFEIDRILDQVGLSSSFRDRFPADLSGGQKQRVNLARALAAEPSLIICDEVTSGLDADLRADIADLLLQLRDRRRLSLLFITHDLSTAGVLADRIMVMHRGRLVEDGPSQAILTQPVHPYTRALQRSVPEPDPGWLGRALGTRMANRPDASNGCGFWSRCDIAIAGVCDLKQPGERSCGVGHRVACYAAACGAEGAEPSWRPVHTST
jgi:peptide/nickel transport system ATP-binding protein